VPRSADPTELLAILRQQGTVERFAFEPPSLSEIFRETVGISLAAAEGRADGEVGA
jgi:ABC-type uncharacterized transport system ATPase subunit